MAKKISINETEHEYTLLNKESEKISFVLNDQQYDFTLIARHPNKLILQDDKNKIHTVYVTSTNAIYDLDYFNVSTTSNKQKSGAGSSGASNEILTPMPGKILQINYKEGESFKKGKALYVLEAMKMEHSVKAPYAGVVNKVNSKVGDLIDGGKEVISVTPNLQEEAN